MTATSDRAALRAQASAYLASLFALGRRRIVLLFALVFAGSLTEAIGIVLLIPLLGLMFAESTPNTGGFALGRLREAVGPGSSSTQLAALLGVFVLLLALRGAVAYLRETRLARLSYDLIDVWRARLVRAVAGASWRRLQEVQPSRLEFALTSEVARLATGSDQLLGGLVAALQALVMLALALRLAPALTAIALALAVLALPLLAPIARAAYRQGQMLTREGTRRQTLFSEFLAGMKLAKIHDTEARYVGEYLALSGAIRARIMAFVAAQARSRNAFQASAGIAAVGILLIGLTITHTPPAELGALLVLLSRLIVPAQALASGGQAILTMLPAVGHLAALEAQLGPAAAPRDGESVAAATAGPVALGLAGVTYRPPGRDRPVIVDADAAIGAGELAVLMGPSGSGKTTLADIVMGLIAPNSGAVSADGAMLGDDESRAAFRRRVGYVPQDPFLFDDTIRANLAWASPEADEAALWAALAHAEAGEFVRALPGGLDAPVGHRGAQLSGGERQRICLARALVRRPGLLILDEATNALDRAVEDRLFETFGHLRGATTILMIAHRIPAGFPADRRWRIDGGRLTEER